MQIKFQKINPRSGDESVLIKVVTDGYQDNPCILIDSGKNVDATKHINDNEYLAAILLTHPHIDHYLTIDKNLQDGARIHTSKQTKQILKHSFDKNPELNSKNHILEKIQTVEDWSQITPEIEVKPIPAGHAPGAVSYYIDINGERILSTGDFSFESMGGWPGFPQIHEIPEIDALFVNTVSSENPGGGGFTKPVEKILDMAISGSDTVVAANTTNCLTVTYLLGKLIQLKNLGLSVCVAGTPASLYQEFGYQLDKVEAVEEFGHPSDLLDSYDIVVASGPTLKHGSSARIFEEVKSDSTSFVAQILAGDSREVGQTQCTFSRFRPDTHADFPDVCRLVDEVKPMHAVVMHGDHKPVEDVEDVFVWSEDTSNKHVLYTDRDGWKPMPWLEVGDRIKENNQVYRENHNYSGSFDVELELFCGDFEDEAIDLEWFSGLEKKKITRTTRTKSLITPSSGASKGGGGDISDTVGLEEVRELVLQKIRERGLVEPIVKQILSEQYMKGKVFAENETSSFIAVDNGEVELVEGDEVLVYKE
ncbi:MAG: MBL fold metallo-hydrolase [Halobacteria archaeon]